MEAANYTVNPPIIIAFQMPNIPRRVNRTVALPRQPRQRIGTIKQATQQQRNFSFRLSDILQPTAQPISRLHQE